MNYFQFCIYKLFRSIIYHLSETTDRLHGNCKHTYPNGKSAMIKGEYYDTCDICGQSEMNESGVQNYDEWYNGKDIVELELNNTGLDELKKKNEKLNGLK